MLILDEAIVDLRGGAEAALAGDVDREAALDDLGDRAVDGDPEVGGLLELGACLRPAAELDAQREDATGIAADARLDRIADLDEQLALAVADLRTLECALGLASDIDEHRVLAERDDLARHHIADLRALGAFRAGFGSGEHRGKVFFVVRSHMGRGTYPKCRRPVPIRGSRVRPGVQFGDALGCARGASVRTTAAGEWTAAAAPKSSTFGDRKPTLRIAQSHIRVGAIARNAKIKLL